VGAKNNLRLNRAKSAEIILTNSKRKHADGLPQQTPDVCRVTSIKMLGVTVTMTNHLSAGEHVRDVIGKCAVTASPEGTVPPRHERRLADARLQSRRLLQAVVCITCMHGGVLLSRPTATS